MRDFGKSPSATSVDDLMSRTDNRCMEVCSEGCLKSNLEDTEEGQSQLDLGMTENSDATDIIHPSDMVSVRKETILCWSQNEDPRLSESTTSIHDIVSCHENSCINDWNEGDGGFAGKNLENIGAGKNVLGKTEHITDKTLITESVVGCAQDLNVEDIVTEFIDQDYSSQRQEPVSEVDAPSHMNEREISICERTKCIIPKTTSMLELLVLNSKKFNPKNDTRKKMAPIWKIIADHRFARPFLKPLTNREAPGYTELVKRTVNCTPCTEHFTWPMDLSTIKKGLSKGRIRTSAEFQRDILLMLQNAVMYNSFNHCVHQKALELQRDVQKLLEVLNEEVKQSEVE